MALDFDDGDLIDGEINGWPVSFIATNYGPQGWALHFAPYTKMIRDEEGSAPAEIVRICDRANDQASDLPKASKAQIRKIIIGANFVQD